MEQEESGGDRDVPSVGSLEGQGSDLEGGDTQTETGVPWEESVHGSSRGSSPEEEREGEDQGQESEPTEGGDSGQGCDEPLSRVDEGKNDGQGGGGNEGDENGQGNGDD